MGDTLVLVACYGGGRRCTPSEYNQDHSLFLRQWEDALTRTHCESDVCFVSNGGPDPQYRSALDRIRTSYSVLDRENVGHSQGAWAAGWRAHPDYSNYIIVEDDYIPVLDRFDQVLRELFASQNCDYLCQHLWSGTVPMMNGIISGECLRKMNGLPGEYLAGQAQADQGQFMLGTTMQRKYGCTVRDMAGRFRIPYMMNGFLPGEVAGGVGVFYPEQTETLFVPAQVYGDPT